MTKHILFILVFFFMNFLNAQIDQQNDEQAGKRMEMMNANMKLEDTNGWIHKAGIGLDLGQLLNINPYIGAGSDRLGIGGAIHYKLRFKKNQFNWTNDVLFNLTVQRIGSGTINTTSDEGLPFEKALDMLSFNSNLAYQITESSAWSYSLDIGLRTQLLSSFIDSASNKIYLKELNIAPYKTSLVSKLFSPAMITLAPGISYSKNKTYQFFLSPVAGQIIVISDQNIANLGVHGTKLKDGSTTEFELTKFALGALAKVSYTNTYFEKLNVGSELSLFSDYLDNPQNIDVVWMNSIGVELFKGFLLGLKLDLYYDHDKTNNISDSNAVGGFSKQGKRINFIEQLLLTYNRSF